jgi:hypothetical protein
MEFLFLHAAITAADRIVSHPVWLAGYRYASIASARLAHLVWHPFLGKSLNDAEA